MRLKDERTDQRILHIPEISDLGYSSMVNHVISRYPSTIYISSAENTRLKHIVNLVNNSERLKIIDSEVDEKDFPKQLAFFEELSKQHVLVIGSMSSNFEIVMQLHRHGPSEHFVELYGGYVWDFYPHWRNIMDPAKEWSWFEPKLSFFRGKIEKYKNFTNTESLYCTANTINA